MVNIKVIAILITSMLGIGFQIALITSYPGFHEGADCSLCHNDPATAYNMTYADAEITLDGHDDEEFWHDYTFRRVYIPVAGGYGAGERMVTLTFTQTETHLYILAYWEDPNINGTDMDQNFDSDGFSIMWNINETGDLSDCFGSQMKTDQVGEAIDVYTWKPTAAESGTEDLSTTTDVNGKTVDYAMDNRGWVVDADQDIEVAAIHGNITDHREEHYQLEMSRPLVTDDPNDVQFDTAGYYEFLVAVFDSSSGAGHIVSFEHSVWIYAPLEDTSSDDEDSPMINIIAIFGIIVMVAGITSISRRKFTK